MTFTLATNNERDEYGLPMHAGKSLMPAIEDIAQHGLIAKAAREHDINPFVFYHWRKQDKALEVAIMTAQMIAADDLIDKCRGITDSIEADTYQVDRVRLQQLTWEASKLHARAWGNDAKIQANVSVNVDIAGAIREATNRREVKVIDQPPQSGTPDKGLSG